MLYFSENVQYLMIARSIAIDQVCFPQTSQEEEKIASKGVLRGGGGGGGGGGRGGSGTSYILCILDTLI